jgi:hypothetical protein
LDLGLDPGVEVVDLFLQLGFAISVQLRRFVN